MRLLERVLNLLPVFDIVKPCDTCKGKGLGFVGTTELPCTTCNGGGINVYLRRRYIVKSKYINIFLHEFFRSDDDPDPHDHPWDFITIVLKGGYTDEGWAFFMDQTPAVVQDPGFIGVLEDGEPDLHRWPYFMEKHGVRVGPMKEEVKAGQIVFRKAEHIHRVQLTDDKKAWTIVITGPERRPWGFVKNGAWVFWRLYLGVWGRKHA